MYIGDIIGILLFCMLVMLPLGYFLRDYLPRLQLWCSTHLFAPRYLKAEGVRRCATKTSVDHQDE